MSIFGDKTNRYHATQKDQIVYRDLTIGNNAIVGSNIDCYNLTTTQNAYVGMWLFAPNTHITDDLIVDGNTTFNNVVVTGDVTLSNLYVTGNITTTNLEVTTDATIHSNLTVDYDLLVGSNLYVISNTVIGQDLVVQNNVAVDNRLGVGTHDPQAGIHVQDGEIWMFGGGVVTDPRVVIGDSSTSGQYGFLQWDTANDYFKAGTDANGLKIKGNNAAIGNIFPHEPLSVGWGTSEYLTVDTDGTTTISNNLIVAYNAIIQNDLIVSGNIYGLTAASEYHTVNIAKEGGDYDNIKDAIASLPETNAQNRWSLIVYPGIYVEDNPIQMKNFTSIVSIGGPLTTVIQPQDPNTYIMNLAPYVSRVSGLQIRNSFHTGIRCSDVEFSGGVFSCVFSNVKQCIVLNSANTETNVYANSIIMKSGNCQNVARCINGHLHIDGLSVEAPVTAESVLYAKGNGAFLDCYTAEIEGDGVEHALHASNGGHVLMSGGLIHSSNIGYYIDDDDYFGQETAHITARNVELQTTRNFDIRVESITADIQCHNSGIARDKAFVLPGGNCMITGYDSFSDVYRMCADTAIGRDRSGHNFYAGQGGPYTFNTRVLTYDGASYVDVTSSDTIAFPNLNANSAIYFGDLDAYSFYAIQYTMGSQIQVVGGATCVWEYYDASTSVAFPGLEMYYTMNSDAATNTVVDNSGTYDGTASQTTATLHEAGKVGTGAFAFLSSRGDILSVLPRPVHSSTISIAVWIKTSTSNQTFIALRLNPVRYIYRLGINSSGYAYFYIRTSSGADTVTDTVTLINNGAWHFLVATYSRTAGANNLQLYVDNGAPIQETHTGALNSSSRALEIGRNYTGSLDNMMIYSTAIDAALANTLWNAGAGTEGATSPGWVPMDGMQDLSGTSTIQSNNYFEGTSDAIYNIRYDQHIQSGTSHTAGTTGWIGTTVNGLPGKWVRYRIDGAGMTTSPIFSDVEFKGSYTRFRPNGTITYYGEAREATEQIIQPYNNINTTASQTMDISANITIPFVQNSFADGAQDSLYFVIPVQTGTDTGCGIDIVIKWFTDITDGAADHTAKMHIYYTKVREGDNCNGGALAETTIDFDCVYVSPAAAGVMVKTEVPTTIYIDNLQRGNKVYCMLRREAAEGGDDLAGYVAIASIYYRYNVWEQGTYNA